MISPSVGQRQLGPPGIATPTETGVAGATDGIGTAVTAGDALLFTGLGGDTVSRGFGGDGNDVPAIGVEATDAEDGGEETVGAFAVIAEGFGGSLADVVAGAASTTGGSPFCTAGSVLFWTTVFCVVVAGTPGVGATDVVALSGECRCRRWPDWIAYGSAIRFQSTRSLNFRPKRRAMP